MAALNAIVFDKTGTLTHAGNAEVTFTGVPLSIEEQAGMAIVAILLILRGPALDIPMVSPRLASTPLSQTSINPACH